jgi:hypothetical protein
MRPHIVFGLFFAACSTRSSLPTHAQDLRVHEWGTFTSMLGSTGRILEGLHHEEEPLPAFVHSRSADPSGMKGLEIVPANVTQKLETPVLYFYGEAREVKVHVDFPKGIISQWYPQAAAFAPSLNAVTEIAGGAMDWTAQLVPGLRDFPAVSAEDIWAPSRNVASVPLTIGGENEQFLFYRGLGGFPVPFQAVANPDGTLAITNQSAEAIPTVFVLRLGLTGGAIEEIGGLDAGQTRSGIQAPSQWKPLEEYVSEASAQVAKALEKSGLYADESKAMVDTWSKSYFRSTGLRLLYVVPREWTDRLLPITITPAPSELTRTLVGRVEVLTPLVEDELVSTVRAAASRGMAGSQLIAQLGRFAEPKLRRVAELVTDPSLRGYLASAIEEAQLMP